MNSSREYFLEFSGSFCNEAQVDASARAFRYFRVITGAQVARNVSRLSDDLIGALFISRSPAEFENMIPCGDETHDSLSADRLQIRTCEITLHQAVLDRTGYEGGKFCFGILSKSHFAKCLYQILLFPSRILMRNDFCWHFLITQDELRFFRHVKHIPAKTDSFCSCKQFF